MSKKEKWLLVVLVVVIAITAMILSLQDKESVSGIQMERPKEGSEVRRFRFLVDDKEELYEIPVYAREKTGKEKEAEFLEVFQWLDSVICGENATLDYVTEDLVLPQKDVQYNATIRWNSNAEHILSKEGTLCRDGLKEIVCVELVAKVTIEKEKQEKTYVVMVLPYEQGSTEEQLAAAKEAVMKQEEATRGEENFVFSENFGNVKIMPEKTSGGLAWLLLLLPVGILGLVVGKKKEVQKEKKQYEREMLAAYPNLVTKLTMYIGAGMTIRTAWEQLAKEYEGKKKEQTHLGKLICQTVAELHMGKGEEAAYEQFGERIGLRPYKRLAAILIGQCSHGGGGMKEALRREVQEAWEVRKEEVKRLGNEAETKLIFPMLGMMILVFGIVVIPAFFSLSL